MQNHMQKIEKVSEKHLFALQLKDLHSYVVHGMIKDNLKLERAVVLFNNITQWVQCMILDHHKPQERAHAIVKFVEIAKVNFLVYPSSIDIKKEPNKRC